MEKSLNDRKNKPTADISRRKEPKERWKTVLVNTFLTLFGLFLTAVLTALAVFAIYMSREMPDRGEDDFLGKEPARGVSQVYYYRFDDREKRVGERQALPDGTLSGGVAFVPARYEDAPKELIDAFIAIEDKRFLTHHGVDWRRTAAAGANYLLGYRYAGKFGASTITQQLIKNTSGDNDNSVSRKLREICRANALENRCTKEEILEKYLNVINLARGCYGVGTAARYYFGKEVRELTPSECATLAAITNNPSYYDPVRFPEHVRARRDLILEEMFRQNYLSEEACRAAQAEELILREACRTRGEKIHSWYVDMVIEDVIRDLCRERGYTREAANRLVWNGGLTIEAAIDPEIQSTVEKYYRELHNFPIHRNGERAQSGIIVLDPATGDILAVAGGIGEKTGNRVQNHATGVVRPAASAIKPLSVYAPALERGLITWASVFDDTPVQFGAYNLDPAKGEIVPPVAWPKNANRLYRGLTDVGYALAHSTNTVAVRVLRELGTEESFHFLHDSLGMENLIEHRTLADGRTVTDCAEAALALGQMNFGVTLRELTAGYTVLAGGGVYRAPRSYYRVLAPDGEVLLSRADDAKALLSEQNACVMTKLLEGVVTRGTATEARLLDGAVAVAGKTGTSNADFDKWFIGYTPELLTGVWYGFDYPRPLSDGQVSGNPAVRIWHDVMTEIVREESDRGKKITKSFPLAEGVIRVTYCPDSGLLPTDACCADLRGARKSEGYFVQGTEPTRYCDRHAFRDCEVAPGERRRVGLLRVKRRFPTSVYVVDEKYSLAHYGG